jgi:hypothetical protein
MAYLYSTVTGFCPLETVGQNLLKANILLLLGIHSRVRKCLTKTCTKNGDRNFIYHIATLERTGE